MRTGPKYKICRRLGDKVFPQCQTTKFSISGSANKTDGKSGGKGFGRRTGTDYGTQLIEKQKVRYTYGLTERQFRNYVRRARERVQVSNPAPYLYQTLEERLDNIVFRAGWANSRAFARQLVSHGHVLVNGRRLTIPSARLTAGAMLSLAPRSRDKALFRDLPERLKDYKLPSWLSWDETSRTLTVKAAPPPSEAEPNLNFSAIIEFYSRV